MCGEQTLIIKLVKMVGWIGQRLTLVTRLE